MVVGFIFFVGGKEDIIVWCYGYRIMGLGLGLVVIVVCFEDDCYGGLGCFELFVLSFSLVMVFGDDWWVFFEF